MNAPALKLSERFTWADYRTWPDQERWELIGGEAIAMSPSPASRHQKISMQLTLGMGPFFKGHRCHLFYAPMDVRLSEEDVVQPDLLVVCHPERIKPTHIEGPPALAVEILSPGSERHDRLVKRELYARFGIEEYWIVTPFPHLIEVFLLRDGLYACWKTFGKEDTLTSPTFPGLSVDLNAVFDFPLEEHEQAIFRVKEARPPPSRSGAYSSSSTR
ncbi:MAG TPA: Uma2 family endonuclease [Kiritimatiellia bacterium]|nr:Uma2 family endonuclease [Kiritimatiellia bacterium]HMO97633.1 Uma2 family endonuclease [Kiritimatiellia bacterium]HMP97750.1 Uma2 family endonuclease [Kiritimatiellia bacterium]